MPEFLDLKPPERALKELLCSLTGWSSKDEIIDTFAASGRISSQAVNSPEPLPAFNRSTVDGYAVIARDTYGASDSLPSYLEIVGEVPMGEKTLICLGTGEAALIHTGGMLPQNSDAVVMVENTQIVNRNELEVLRAAAPGENILFLGEDVSADEQILTAGKRLGPADIGGLAAVGILKVMVAIPPKVGIISSGDEVVPPSVPLSPGKVRDVNTYSLASLVSGAGGVVRTFGIIPDNRDLMASALSRALVECDMVVVTAGSSASARDLTADVINELGKPGVIVHGVNVRPGKPTILAVCDGKPVIGLPGNPVSALIIANLFVKPLIDFFFNIQPRTWRPYVLASLGSNIPSQAGREDWVPVVLKTVEKNLIAVPIFYKSNFIFNLSKADGLIRITPDANGLAAGTMVEVFPL